MRRLAGWWRGRASLYIFGGVLVAAVVASGAVLAFTDGKQGPVAASATAPQKQAAARSDSACGMPAGDQRVPLRPPRAHWDRVGAYQVPGSTVVGPGVVDGHVRRCYARSPTGAVFAAYGYFSAQLTWPTDVAMLRELTAQSAARDEALRQGGSPPTDPNKTVELVGFRVLDYSPAAATVLLAARVAPAPSAEMDLGQTASELGAASVRLLWERGDWKVAVEPQGFQAEPLDSIAGLVPWSAP